MAESGGPLSWPPLPWQRAAWAPLWRRQGEGRMPHALLLCGPPGVGKRAFVERLAAALFCARPGADGEPCGECRGCRLRAAGNHPDRIELRPEEGKTTIGIERVRQLGGELALTPQYGGYKLAVIEPADALTIAAANSLLKTLEEPSPGSLIALLSARASALPATVRSRCQRLLISPPPRAEGLAWLGGEWPPERCAQALDEAAGAPLLARRLLAGEGALEAAAQWSEQWLALLERRADPTLLAEQWAAAGLRPALQWLLASSAELARLAALRPRGASDAGVAPGSDGPGCSTGLRRPSRAGAMQAAAQHINSRKLLDFREQLEQLHARELQGLNAHNVLEGLLLEASRLFAVRQR